MRKVGPAGGSHGSCTSTVRRSRGTTGGRSRRHNPIQSAQTQPIRRSARSRAIAEAPISGPGFQAPILAPQPEPARAIGPARSRALGAADLPEPRRPARRGGDLKQRAAVPAARGLDTIAAVPPDRDGARRGIAGRLWHRPKVLRPDGKRRARTSSASCCRIAARATAKPPTPPNGPVAWFPAPAGAN